MSNIPRHRHETLTGATAALVAACFIFIFSSTSAAQEMDGPPETELALLIRLEADIQLLNSGKILRNPDIVALKAERRLKDILERNPNASFHFQATEALRQVQEYLGSHQLSIATFYLGQEHKGKGSLKGAESRLSEIVRKYPRFSKMDEVRLKLSIVASRPHLQSLTALGEQIEKD